MIYHYTNFKAAISIIKNKNIRLSSSLGMNDRTERFYANLCATIFILTSKDELITRLRNNISVDDIIRVNKDTLEIPFYSASFCRREDNEYLWENYSDKYAGVCIAFNDEYLLNCIKDMFKQNYKPSDTDEKENECLRDVVPIRSVYYEDLENIVIDVVRKVQPADEKNMEDSPFSYKNWLELVFSVVAGVMKDVSFKEEEEVRILFQNVYKEDFMSKNGMGILTWLENKKSFSKLGLCEEKTENGKNYYELNLKEFFNSTLIPKIVLGKNCTPEDHNVMKEILRSNQLNDTELNDAL